MDSSAKKKARSAYRERNDVVRVVMDLPRSTRDLWRSRAESLGVSLTAYIVGLVNADLAGVQADSPADSDEPTV